MDQETSTLRTIIDLDVRGEATDEQVAELESDLVLWKDELVALLRDVDSQLTERKAKSIAGGKSARVDYENWKRGAVKYKSCVEKRLHDVKAMLRDTDAQTPSAKLTELQNIRKVLEEIRDDVRHFIQAQAASRQ